jgi:hypothetical protein
MIDEGKFFLQIFCQKSYFHIDIFVVVVVYMEKWKNARQMYPIIQVLMIINSAKLSFLLKECVSIIR